MKSVPPQIDRAARSVPVARYIQAAILFGLCFWLAHNFYSLIHRSAALYVPMPQGDYWRVPENLKAYQTFRLAAFWRQHNEHRILFPEIVFAVDMLIAHGRMILPTVVSILAYVLAWAALCVPVVRDRATPPFTRWCAILLSGSLVFWSGAALSLAQPFLLQWTLTELAVVLAFCFLKKAVDSRRLSNLSLAIAAAVVATYSSANGLLLWPLLLALAFWFRLSRPLLRILVLAAIIFVGLYFVGYQFSGQTNVLAILRHPLYFAGFALTYLAVPFANLISPSFAIAVGAVNLAFAIFAVFVAARSRAFNTPPFIVLAGFYAFTLLTIFITAAGRMEPSDGAFINARAVRYLSEPLLDWGAVLLFFFWAAARIPPRLRTTAALAVVFSLLIAIGFYKLRAWLRDNETPFLDAQVASLSLDAGVVDPSLIARIFPSPDFLDNYLPPLQKQHLALYHLDHQNWFGKDLIRFGLTLDVNAAGGISHSSPVVHGVEIVGWLNPTDLRDPHPKIILVNEQNKAVGWGRRPAGGFPPDWISTTTPAEEAWIAYANLDRIPSRRIFAYAITRKGVVRIPGVVEVKPLEGASPNEVGAPLAGAAWRPGGAWVPNGVPVAPRWGWHPKDSPVYGSWRTSDADTGQIEAEITAPANGCVALATLHGPSAGGLSARLRNAGNGTLLGEIPFRDHDYLWSLWKIKVDPNTKLTFSASDEGKHWGEWLAVGGPLACN